MSTLPSVHGLLPGGFAPTGTLGSALRTRRAWPTLRRAGPTSGGGVATGDLLPFNGRLSSTVPSVVADLVVGGSDSGSALWDISGESGTGSPPGV